MARRPLEGIKVVAFAWWVTGPITAKYLGAGGAEVIKVESFEHYDSSRLTTPYKDNKSGLNRSGYFAKFNSDVYSMVLALASPRGLEIARRLVSWADIIIENYRGGVIEKLGLGYDDCKKIKPDIIMMSLSGTGRTGPLADMRGHGITGTAFSGFGHLTGWPDRGGALPFGAYTDFIVPRLAVIALLAALDYRRRTGKGQYLDISQWEAGIEFLAPAVLEYTANHRVMTRRGNRSRRAAPHGAYRCRGDDRWCVIAVHTDEEWKSFGKVIGSPAWTQAPRFATMLGRLENADELDRLVESWTINHSPEEVMTLMQASTVPAGVVENAADIHNDPQLEHRRHFKPLEHPELGIHPYEMPAYRLSQTPIEIRMPAPCLGEHTEYVCKEILRMSDEEFLQLLEEGILQ